MEAEDILNPKLCNSLLVQNTVIIEALALINPLLVKKHQFRKMLPPKPLVILVSQVPVCGQILNMT